VDEDADDDLSTPGMAKPREQSYNCGYEKGASFLAISLYGVAGLYVAVVVILLIYAHISNDFCLFVCLNCLNCLKNFTLILLYQ
jgi:hypothetical protein